MKIEKTANMSEKRPLSGKPHRLRPSGGCRGTASFQTATIIYDATYWFRERFLDSRSRMVDQMVQAARSGRQDIAEGSRAAAISSQTESRLFNTARASLEELPLDYEDFLLRRRLKQWAPDSPEAMAVRQAPQRIKRDRPGPSDSIPACPKCGEPMSYAPPKRARTRAGCSAYPDCKGVEEV